MLCYKASWHLHTRLSSKQTAENCAAYKLFSETFINTCRHYPQFFQLSSFPEGRSEDGRTVSADLVSPETINLAFRSSPPLLSHASADSAPSSIGSSESSFQKASSNTSEISSSSSETDRFAGQLIVRKACRFDCYCSCHPKTQVQGNSKPSFRKSSSYLGFSSSRCNDPNCRSGKSDNRIADPISTFFHKTLSHIMSAHSIKVRCHLNIFRMVPENTDAMRYAKQGKLDRLKTAIESGDATLWDTEPDGWSLLHVSRVTRTRSIIP